MAKILASNQPLEIDVAGGSSFKSLICLSSKTVSGTVNVTEEETDCGILTSTGSVKFTFSADAVCETAPGGSELSHSELIVPFVNKTLVTVRFQNPIVVGSSIGTEHYISCSARITQLDITGASADYLKFSVTLVSDGPIDITA